MKQWQPISYHCIPHQPGSHRRFLRRRGCLSPAPMGRAKVGNSLLTSVPTILLAQTWDPNREVKNQQRRSPLFPPSPPPGMPSHSKKIARVVMVALCCQCCLAASGRWGPAFAQHLLSASSNSILTAWAVCSYHLCQCPQDLAHIHHAPIKTEWEALWWNLHNTWY